LEAVPGVERAEVTLIDHHASDEINWGVTNRRGFVETFPDEATEELDELRRLFVAKAFLAREGRLAAELRRRGLTAVEIASERIINLPESDDTCAYLARRAELGLDTSPAEPFLVDAAGRTVAADAIDPHLRFIRAVALSLETNASFCKGLLATRYRSPGEVIA
ncbi:MAG: metal-sulfur cluster biosynthetic enzyme, partial [Actinomycetota bacterium]